MDSTSKMARPAELKDFIQEGLLSGRSPEDMKSTFLELMDQEIKDLKIKDGKEGENKEERENINASDSSSKNKSNQPRCVFICYM